MNFMLMCFSVTMALYVQSTVTHSRPFWTSFIIQLSTIRS